MKQQAQRKVSDYRSYCLPRILIMKPEAQCRVSDYRSYCLPRTLIMKPQTQWRVSDDRSYCLNRTLIMRHLAQCRIWDLTLNAVSDYRSFCLSRTLIKQPQFNIKELLKVFLLISSYLKVYSAIHKVKGCSASGLNSLQKPFYPSSPFVPYRHLQFHWTYTSPNPECP